MAILLIGSDNFSKRMYEKLVSEKYSVIYLEGDITDKIEENIKKAGIEYVINYGHKKNINHYINVFSQTEIISHNLKLDIMITDLCIKYNKKLLYFENANNKQDKMMSELYKIYSSEKSLNVNIIKIGNILDRDFENINTYQHIANLVLKSKENLKYEYFNHNIFYNLDTEILFDIHKKINNFENNYNIFDYSDKSVALVNIAQAFISLSGLNINIINNDKKIYNNPLENNIYGEYIREIFYYTSNKLEISEINNLTDNEIKLIENILSQFDKNGDGYLNIEELYNLFNNIGITSDTNKFIKLFKQSDINSDGKISKQELIILMKKNFNKMNSSNEGPQG